MPVVSVTRLRVRSVRFLPAFIWDTARSLRQARNSDGCLRADVRREKGLAFWTRTVWRDLAAMQTFVGAGAHRAAMPKLREWCDEAAVVHWQEGSPTFPDWQTAAARLRAEGRLSRVRYPSRAHGEGERVP